MEQKVVTSPWACAVQVRLIQVERIVESQVYKYTWHFGHHDLDDFFSILVCLSPSYQSPQSIITKCQIQYPNSFRSKHSKRKFEFSHSAESPSPWCPQIPCRRAFLPTEPTLGRIFPSQQYPPHQPTVRALQQDQCWKIEMRLKWDRDEIEIYKMEMR